MSIETDLIDAIKKQDIQGVKNAIQNGANVNYKPDMFLTPSEKYAVPMYEAARSNNIEIMSLLNIAGADINLENESGEFPLYIALDAGADDAARWLMDKGANIDLRNVSGLTVMHVAANKGNIDMCQLLMEKGAKVNVGGYAHMECRITPAQIAAKKGYLDLVKWFESQGVDIFEKGYQGCSLASYAAEGNATKVLEWLIDRGIDVNDINILSKAVYSSSFDALRLLVSHGADINKEISSGYSMMTWTLRYPDQIDLKIVLTLLSLGADLKLSELCRLLKYTRGYDKIFDEGSKSDHILAGLNILRSIDNLQSKGPMIVTEGLRSADLSQIMQKTADKFAKTLVVKINDLVESVPSADTLTIKEIAQKQAECKDLISKYTHISKELLNRYALEQPLSKFVEITSSLEKNKLERVSNAFLNAPESSVAVSVVFKIKEVTRSIGSHLNPDDQTALTEAWPEVKVTTNGLSTFDQDITDHLMD